MEEGTQPPYSACLTCLGGDHRDARMCSGEWFLEAGNFVQACFHSMRRRRKKCSVRISFKMHVKVESITEIKSEFNATLSNISII